MFKWLHLGIGLIEIYTHISFTREGMICQMNEVCNRQTESYDPLITIPQDLPQISLDRSEKSLVSESHCVPRRTFMTFHNTSSVEQLSSHM